MHKTIGKQCTKRIPTSEKYPINFVAELIVLKIVCYLIGKLPQSLTEPSLRSAQNDLSVVHRARAGARAGARDRLCAGARDTMCCND